MQKLKIHNGRVITPARVIPVGTVVVDDGIIMAIAEGDLDVEGAEVIDAARQYIAPGFIDIHVHGGGGYDFMDETEEAFIKIAETHTMFGTTSMVPAKRW
jgi:N-acetylglucosamine-6-phosphate deacetylase